MENRWAQIEGRVGELEGLLRSVDGRLQRIERRLELAPEPAAFEEAPSAPETLAPESFDFVVALALTGRLLLGLAGGYLLRAMTSSGMLPGLLGAAAGLGYAAAWLFLADRAGGRGRPAAAGFYGTTAALVALPLIWETTVRFGILAPGAGAIALAAIAGLGLAVAWRHGLPALVWVVGLGASVGAVALGGPAGAPVPYAAVTVAIGGAVLWLARRRSWRGLAWATAAVADLAVLLLWAESPATEGLASTAGVLTVQLGLFVVYAGSFVVYTGSLAARRRPLTVLAAVQTMVVVVVGFAGALAVAPPAVAAGVGIAGLVLALAAQAAARAAGRAADGGAASGLYFGGLATALLFAASSALLPSPALLWAGLAIPMAGLAALWGRSSLRLQAAVLAVAAVLGSGLAASALYAWTRPVESWAALAAGPWLALAALAACLLFPGRAAGPWLRRFELGLLALTVFAAGGAAVRLAVSIVAGSPADAATLAVVRTAVLAAAALALAVAAGGRWSVAASLVYPLLLLGAVKLLIEDFPAGDPATLFVSLALFGGALILAPRRLRAAAG